MPDGGDQTPPPPPTGGRANKVALIAVAAVVGIAVVAGAAAFFLLKGSGEQLLDNVPASADVVAAVYLDPSAGQKTNLLRLADEIPALGSREQLTSQAQDTIDQLLSQAGLGHEDLEWVGAEVAVAVSLPDDATEPGVVVLIDADDEAAAAQTLADLRESDAGAAWETRDHDGVEVWAATNDALDSGAYAIVDGVVAASNDQALIDEVIDVTHGNGAAIADDEAFTETTGELPDGKLAMFYVNPGDLVQRVNELQGLTSDPDLAQSLEAAEAFTGMAMSLSAESDGMAVDVEVSIDPSKLSDSMRATLSEEPAENALLTAVPNDALVVMAQQGLDASIADAVDQIETFSPDVAEMLTDAGVTGEGGVVDSLTGDIALTALPGVDGGTPSGAFLIGTEDEAALSDAANDLVQQFTPDSVITSGNGGKDSSSTVEWRTEDYQGVEVHTLGGSPDESLTEVSYAVIEGAGVIALTPDAMHAVIDAQQGGDGITTSSAYADAMDGMPDGSVSVYVDIDGIADAIRATIPPDQAAEFDRFAGETMDHLDSFVVGSEQSEEHVHVRMFLRVP
jgi:hypothetical protein